jgi:hypothetical protein
MQNTRRFTASEVLGATRRASKDAARLVDVHPSRLARYARSHLRMTA